MQISEHILTPDVYDKVSREKMLAAGVLKMVSRYEHNEDYSKFNYVGSEYHFKDGRVLTELSKFREKVYGK
jgi:hypothetical protein